MKHWLILLILSLCLTVSPVCSAVEITGMRLAEKSAGTVRFVADLSDESSPKISRLENPARLVIDFPQTSFSSAAKQQKLGKTGFVGGVRTGTPFEGTARVVLDLPASILTEQHFLLKPQGGLGWRFVLDVSNNQTAVLPVTSASTAPPPVVGLTSLKPTKKAKVVVLDPGHGGQDPGAISKSGYYEKNITLNMAKETKALLEKAGYKVVLTRDKDVFIPLRGRIKKAHEAQADLFISIHADSAKSSSAQGLSIYTISERASDAEAAALAERENKADIIMEMDLSDIDPQAGSVLLSLAKTEMMNRSVQFAQTVVREMRKNVKLVPNAHKYAGFVVLKSPSVPSVLIELGYLSNRDEDKKLQKKDYRQKLAEAIVRATKDYFANISD